MQNLDVKRLVTSYMFLIIGFFDAVNFFVSNLICFLNKKTVLDALRNQNAISAFEYKSDGQVNNFLLKIRNEFHKRFYDYV